MIIKISWPVNTVSLPGSWSALVCLSHSHTVLSLFFHYSLYFFIIRGIFFSSTKFRFKYITGQIPHYCIWSYSAVICQINQEQDFARNVIGTVTKRDAFCTKLCKPTLLDCTGGTQTSGTRCIPPFHLLFTSYRGRPFPSGRYCHSASLTSKLTEMVKLPWWKFPSWHFVEMLLVL